MTIAVATSTPALLEEGYQLATLLKLPFTELTSTAFKYLLVLEENKLVLHFPQHRFIKPFFIDFSHGEMGYRAQHAVGRNELIAKAVGIKKEFRPFVIDATAGLARDGFLLASLGCKIILLEQSAIIYSLVNDGLKRFEREHADISNKLILQLINIDAVDYLKRLTPEQYPDVIYLDPMFPARTKTAKVKKEMQILQDLIGENDSCESLFTLALQKAKKRVVVKRPIHAPELTEKNSDLVFKGKNTRFDVYLAVTRNGLQE